MAKNPTMFYKSMVLAAAIATITVFVIGVAIAAAMLLKLRLLTQNGMSVVLWSMLCSSLWFGIARTIIHRSTRKADLELWGSILVSSACVWFAGEQLAVYHRLMPTLMEKAIFFQLFMLVAGATLIAMQFGRDGTPTPQRA